MQFLSGKLNAITGGEVNLELELEADAISPGNELRAEARLRSPERRRLIEYLRISLTGQIQRDGAWHDYVQSAEVAQDTSMPADHELVVPIVIRVPGDAVLTEDGATWCLQARAYLDNKVDPRAEVTFTVESE